MTRVQDILKTKGHAVHSVGPDDMVLAALKLMARQDIGAVMVTEGDRLRGIFSERHYARNVFLKGRGSPDTPVGAVMRTDGPQVTPGESVEACMALMTQARVRHLPVIENGRLVGVISIGDLMKSMIDEREFSIERLVEYVRG